MPSNLQRFYLQAALLAAVCFMLVNRGSGAVAEESGHGKQLAKVRNAGCWQVYYPSPSGPLLLLSGVAASSSDDVWSYGEVLGGVAEVLHFDGTSWRIVATPNLPETSEWWDIRSRGSGDVWAAAETPAGPYVAHWDGVAWNVIPSPTIQGQLLGIAPLRDGSVWAVGDQPSAVPLVERLDRATGEFKIDKRVDRHFMTGVFDAVAGVTPDSLFAGGQSGNPSLALLEQHKPARHRWVAAPGQPVANVISSLSVRSKTDAWAVGPPCCSSATPFVEHWNGTSWSDVSSPESGTVRLYFVDAPPKSRLVWVAGSNWQTGEAFVARYDGKRWRKLALPTAQIRKGGINALSHVPGSREEWAVGGYRVTPSRIAPVALLWSCD